MVHCVCRRVLCADELWLRVGRSTRVQCCETKSVILRWNSMQSVSSTPGCTSWQHLLLHTAFFSLSMFAHIQTISIMKCFLLYYLATIFYLHCMWLGVHNVRPSPSTALWWKCLNSEQHKARELSQTSQHCKNRLFNLLIWPDAYANLHDMWSSFSPAKAINFRRCTKRPIGVEWERTPDRPCDNAVDIWAQLCGNSISLSAHWWCLGFRNVRA